MNPSRNESPTQGALEPGAPPPAVLGPGAPLPEPQVPSAAAEEPVPDADDECSGGHTAVGQLQRVQRRGHLLA